jgi:hypothetical protein
MELVCPLWVISGHVQCTGTCLLSAKAHATNIADKFRGPFSNSRGLRAKGRLIQRRDIVDFHSTTFRRGGASIEDSYPVAKPQAGP